MAAISPDTLRQQSLGSVALLIADFSAGTADDGDTWASGLGSNVVGFWAQDTDNPSTQGSVGTAISNSSGTFTLYPAEDNKSFTVYVLATV